MRYLLIILFTILFYTCANRESRVLEQDADLRIEYHRLSCYGDEPTACFLAQEGDMIGTKRWNLFYDSVKGFEFEEGYRYDLKVKIEKHASPREDGSDKSYTLVSVEKKVPVKHSPELLLSSATK